MGPMTAEDMTNLYDDDYYDDPSESDSIHPDSSKHSGSGSHSQSHSHSSSSVSDSDRNDLTETDSDDMGNGHDQLKYMGIPGRFGNELPNRVTGRPDQSMYAETSTTEMVDHWKGDNQVVHDHSSTEHPQWLIPHPQTVFIATDTVYSAPMEAGSDYDQYQTAKDERIRKR